MTIKINKPKKSIYVYPFPNNKKKCQQISHNPYSIQCILVDQNLDNDDQTDTLFSIKNQNQLSIDTTINSNINIDQQNQMDSLLTMENQLPINNLISSNIKSLQINKKSKKTIYKKGPEFQRLLSNPHYGESYENLEIYNRLGKPGKKDIMELGEEYNKHFKMQIENHIYPKFGRDQKRNKALAIWFFEDCKRFIIPWLNEIGSIDKK